MLRGFTLKIYLHLCVDLLIDFRLLNGPALIKV